MDDANYAAHIEYCMINPVKHGLVKQVADWTYSTFHRDVVRGIFPVDWAGSADFSDEFDIYDNLGKL